jgi:hypothetical protein
MTATEAIRTPGKDGVWAAPESLRDAAGKPVSSQSGRNLMLVRVEIRQAAMRDAAKFTLSQFRLVCGPKTAAGPLAAKGEAVYPAGYIGAGGRLETKPLGEIISIDPAKVGSEGVTMDLAFQVPTSLTPALVEFKRNNVAKVSAVAASENAPQPIPFGSPAPQQPQAAPQPEPQAQEAAPAEPNAGASSNRPRQRRGLSDISRSVTGDVGEEN